MGKVEIAGTQLEGGYFSLTRVNNDQEAYDFTVYDYRADAKVIEYLGSIAFDDPASPEHIDEYDSVEVMIEAVGGMTVLKVLEELGIEPPPVDLSEW